MATRVTVPEGKWAVSTQVVDIIGDMNKDPEGATSPSPEMEQLVAFRHDQDKLTDSPCWMEGGAAKRDTEPTEEGIGPVTGLLQAASTETNPRRPSKKILCRNCT